MKLGMKRAGLTLLFLGYTVLGVIVAVGLMMVDIILSGFELAARVWRLWRISVKEEIKKR